MPISIKEILAEARKRKAEGSQSNPDGLSTAVFHKNIMCDEIAKTLRNCPGPMIGRIAQELIDFLGTAPAVVTYIGNDDFEVRKNS